MDYMPVAHIRALQTQIAVPTTVWVQVKVGTSNLPDRKWVEIFNRSPYKIYYSYDNTLSVREAFAVRAGGKLIVPLSEDVSIYLRGSSNGSKVIIAEVS